MEEEALIRKVVTTSADDLPRPCVEPVDVKIRLMRHIYQVCGAR